MKRIAKAARGCGWTKTDVRPSTWNIHDNCCGDCTTRAVTYALNGEMTYDEVESEQYRLAKVYGKVRNCTGIYDLILRKKGWKWIQFSKCMTRGEVAIRLNKRLPNVTALALSRTHIACVKGGELIDTWDSRGGKVFAIMVPGDVINEAVWAIDTDGYSQKEIGEMECTVVAPGCNPRVVRAKAKATKKRRGVIYRKTVFGGVNP